MIYFLTITVLLWVAAFFLGQSANRMGDGGLGLGLVVWGLGAAPVIGWLIWLLVFAVRHVRFA